MRTSSTPRRVLTAALITGLLLTAATPAAAAASTLAAAAPAAAKPAAEPVAAPGMALTALQQRCFTWMLFGSPVPLHQLTIGLRNDRPGVASKVTIRYVAAEDPRSPRWTHTTVRQLSGAETEFTTSFTSGADASKFPVLRVDTRWSDGRTEAIGPLAPAYSCS